MNGRSFGAQGGRRCAASRALRAATVRALRADAAACPAAFAAPAELAPLLEPCKDSDRVSLHRILWMFFFFFPLFERHNGPATARPLQEGRFWKSKKNANFIKKMQFALFTVARMRFSF